MSKMSDYALALEAERVRVWRLDEQAERDFLLKYTKDRSHDRQKQADKRSNKG